MNRLKNCLMLIVLVLVVPVLFMNFAQAAGSDNNSAQNKAVGASRLQANGKEDAGAVSAEEAMQQAKDPASVGMSMTSLSAEIARLDAKGTDITEAEKATRSDYQAILELDNQILTYDRRSKIIARIVGGDNTAGMRSKTDEYSVANLEKYIRECQNKHKNLKRLSLDNLQGFQSEVTTFLDGADKEVSRMDSYVESINSLPKDFQNKSSELTDKIIANRNALSGLAMGNGSISSRMRLEAEIAGARAELAYDQFIMQNSNVLYERLRTRINSIKQAREVLTRIQEDVSRRITVIKQTEVLSEEKEENSQLLKEAGDSVLVKALAEDNNHLILRLSEGFQSTKLYNDQNTQLLKLIDRTRKVEGDIDNQIKYFENSVFLSQILFNQRYIIPDFSLPSGVSEEVGRLRMELYGYGVELEQIYTPEQFLTEFVSVKGLPASAIDEYTAVLPDGSTMPDASSKGERDPKSRNIRRLLELREAILTRLYSETTVEVNSAVNLIINYEKYVKLKQNLNEQIYDRMFWSPSNSSLLKSDWVTNFPGELERQHHYINGNLARVTVLSPKFSAFSVAAPLFLLALLLFFFRKRMRQGIADINSRLSSFVTDSQLNTIKVLALTAAGTLWMPLWIFTFGIFGLNCVVLSDNPESADKIMSSVQSMLFIFCLCVWARNFILAVFGPKTKIAEKHFGLTVHARVLKCLARIMFVFCITLILCIWKVEEPQTLAVDIVGQLSLIGLSIYMLLEFILWEVYIWKGHRAIGGLFTNAIPIVLSGVVIVLTIRGYYYSGACITLHFIESFFACFVYLIISNIIARSMKLASRRINYRRWQETRKNASSGVKEEHADSEGEIVEITEKEMSTSEMSSQTLVIVRYVLFSILILALYHIWSGLLSVTSYFEYINLYDIKADDNSVIRSVSLMDILFVIYALVITFVFLRNMPGVLEVLIFNRFAKLDTYGYSIITLCNYICVGVCAVFCLSRLGISWSELQWMVAALSVGLGFGLQEIFANFMSGIIILFERPIRIGDIITIHDNSGVVSKIRIRATTIINFDYKEYVVPNKEFITTAIVNWSLHDTMTRIVVEVGVGYGSNVDEVRKALYRVAEANQYTLKDPAPNVYFLSFGDSNLNFELRVYVKKITERNACLDSLNTEIYNEFNRLGIEIAFNQMDVYIKNVNNGQEIKVQGRDGVLPNNLMSGAVPAMNAPAGADGSGNFAALVPDAGSAEPPREGDATLAEVQAQVQAQAQAQAPESSATDDASVAPLNIVAAVNATAVTASEEHGAINKSQERTSEEARKSVNASGVNANKTGGNSSPRSASVSGATAKGTAASGTRNAGKIAQSTKKSKDNSSRKKCGLLREYYEKSRDNVLDEHH